MPENPFNRKLQTVIIEDDEDHVQILTVRLQQSKSVDIIEIFASGSKAIEFLQLRAKNQTTPNDFPMDLILLDLGLEGEEDGLSVLKKLKAHPQLKKIPVIIYTASQEKADIAASYRLGGTFFMNKQWDPTILQEAIQHLNVLRSQH